MQFLHSVAVVFRHFAELKSDTKARTAAHYFRRDPQLGFIEPDRHLDSCSLLQRNRHLDKASTQAQIGCFAPNARSLALRMKFDRIDRLYSEMATAGFVRSLPAEVIRSGFGAGNAQK